MTWPAQPETMQTAKGRRITARPGATGGVALVIFGIEITMTADETEA